MTSTDGGRVAAEPLTAPAAPLRLLLLYDCLYPEAIGGVEHRNALLAESLRQAGHRVTVAGLGRAAGPGQLALGRPPRPGRRRGVGGLLRFLAAVVRVDLGPYDVVETANLPYVHLPVLAGRCRRHGRPLVVTWHEVRASYWRRRWGYPVSLPLELGERWTARMGARAVAVSDLTARRVAARRGGSVPVVPNGVPVDVIRAAARGQEPRAPLVFAGRLLPEKRLDLLLHAVAQFSATRRGPLLTIIGDGPERRRLERLKDVLGLDGLVRFLGRLESEREVWQALGSARIAVQPSEREGFGLFPLEAMAVGLPVVYCASPESAVGELVRHEVEGVSTAPEPRALAACLERLLSSQVERDRLAEAAARRAVEFDWGHVAGDFVSLCRELAAAVPVRSSG